MGQPNRRHSIWHPLMRGIYDLVTRAVLDESSPYARQNSSASSFLPLFMQNAEDIRDELLQLETLWRRYRERRLGLEIRQATHGINADPAVTIEIQRIKSRMEYLSNRYNLLLKMLQQITKEPYGKQAIAQTDYLNTTAFLDD